MFPLYRWHRAASLPLGAALLASCGEAPVEVQEDVACVSDADFFEQEVYPEVVQQTCLACHTADGVARDSDLVFVGQVRPDHVEVNADILREVATLERDGESLIVRKPRGDDGHGGGAVLTRDDPGYALLEQFVARVKEPVVCEGEEEVIDEGAGLALLSPLKTLRKATLLLGGRLPTTDEVEMVRAGGETAVSSILWGLMSAPEFDNRAMELFNDVLLTDRYTVGSTDAIGITDDETFPNVYWYADYSDTEYYAFRRATNDAIAREPLELMAHVLREDLPWREVLLADYTMVNAYSAQAYAIADAPYPNILDPDAEAFWPAKIPEFPHAGILSTASFLNRWPTTPTNRNRKRTWFFYKTFLATDILEFADRPIDPTSTETHNPTLNDAQCTVCHATMDPVAGAFQNWDDEGRYRPPENGWYAEMAAPGFGDVELPIARRPDGLRWLAEQAVEDPRFAVASVRLALEALTGLELLTPMMAGDDPIMLEALRQQDQWIDTVAAEFSARDENMKYVFEAVILSRYFRADDDLGASEGSLHHAGTAKMLSPEELDRKIIATLGFPWRDRYNSTNYLQGSYEILYGGIDSFGIIDRLVAPNGVTAAVVQRMATKMACTAVTRDFVVPRAQRRLFPHVEPTWAPKTAEDFDVPEVEAHIRENIRWLHYRLLGEELSPGSDEENITYTLFYETWREGREGLASGDIDRRIVSSCRATNDFWTGENLPSELRLEYDDDYLIRSWMAVVAYLVTDYRFLYE